MGHDYGDLLLPLTLVHRIVQEGRVSKELSLETEKAETQTGLHVQDGEMTSFETSEWVDVGERMNTKARLLTKEKAADY